MPSAYRELKQYVASDHCCCNAGVGLNKKKTAEDVCAHIITGLGHGIIPEWHKLCITNSNKLRIMGWKRVICWKIEKKLILDTVK